MASSLGFGFGFGFGFGGVTVAAAAVGLDAPESLRLGAWGVPPIGASLATSCQRAQQYCGQSKHEP